SVLGGESFFITTVSAPSKGGEVTLAPAVPGDITAVDITGKPLLVQRGSYLASGPGVEIDTQFAGLKGLIGGEGLFFLRISGSGTAFITSFGAIHRRALAPGERYIVDSGHMVAYEEGMQMTTRMAGSDGGFLKRALTSATTGEGLVMEFTGPGEVWLQTRNPQAFSGWIQGMLPTPSSSNAGSAAAAGGAAAVLGSLFGGGAKD
ncbi:MAG: TIGR00266 family protein, partial [Candidatus Sericytochromatia bacterium]|nr:TIGR00266 family protein [Candidatus Sericytochromatia bacterium]